MQDRLLSASHVPHLGDLCLHEGEAYEKELVPPFFRMTAALISSEGREVLLGFKRGLELYRRRGVPV